MVPASLHSLPALLKQLPKGPADLLHHGGEELLHGRVVGGQHHYDQHDGVGQHPEVGELTQGFRQDGQQRRGDDG